MNKRAKKLMSMVLTMTTLLALTACGASESTEAVTSETSGQTAVSGNVDEGRPYAGQTIRVVAANHDYGEYIKDLIPEFEEMTGIDVELESYADDPLTQKLTVELTSGNSNMDVFMTRPLQDGLMFHKNGWYEPLDSYINDPEKTDSEWDYEDFVTLDWSSGTVEDITFIPITNEFEVLYYNKAIFAEAGLEVPTTFEELMETAAKLTDAENEIYGITSRGNMGAATSPFSGYLFGFGGDYLTDGRCGLNSEGAVKAFQYYGELLANYGPPGAINMAWPQCVPIFLEGKAAMFTDAAGLLPQVSDLGDDLGVAVMPGGKPWIAPTWGLSIASTSTKKDAAWEFVQWASSKEVLKKCALERVTQARRSVMEDPEVIAAQHPGFMDIASHASENGVPYDKPVMMQVGQARDYLGEVIVKSIESAGTADIQALADDCAVKIDKLLEESGELRK